MAGEVFLTKLKGMSALTPEQQERLLAIMMDHARSGETSALQEAYERGYPLDIQDGDGNTALMLAAYNGQVETLRMLITRGADVNLRNNRDQSPIAGAIFKGEEEVVEILRQAGADLDAGTPTARQTAELFGKSELLE